MTGLDKITERILIEAENNAEMIMEEANAKVKEILSQARIEANRQAIEIVEKAEAEAAQKTAIAKSTAESITRNRYLEIRNAILNDVISAAYLKIEKFSDEEYFDIIKKLCIKHFQPGECVMQMSNFDLCRMPESFEDSINSEVYEKGAVQVSDEPVDIENGFILKYNGFEINCALRAVFDESMDNLKDTLSKELFH